VVGGLLFSHYAKTPVATPAAAMMIPASDEMIQMVRDEHALFIDTLKNMPMSAIKLTSLRRRIQEDDAVEQAATLATREARTAEARALAIAAHTAKRAEKNISEKQSAPYLDKAVISEPLQLQSDGAASTTSSARHTAATSPAELETRQRPVAKAA